jgi:hypothetical protein
MRPQLPRTIVLAFLVAAHVALPARADGRRSVLDISAGAFHGTDPSTTGFLVGVGGRLIQRERFSLAIRADYVRMHQDVVQAVASANTSPGHVDVAVVEDDNSRHYVPAFLSANFGLGDTDSNLRPYLIGSIGWAAIRSYHDNSEGTNSRTFTGPVFEAGLGLVIHSAFFVEGMVNAGSVDRNNDDPRNGTPLDEEASPTGFAIRAGFRL